MDFASRLTELRKNLDITQAELSKKTGIGRSTIASYEATGKKPPMDRVIQLADFFDVSVDYLLGNTNTKEKSNNKSKNNENILDLDFDMLTDDEIDDTFTSYLKKQDRVMFFDPESDRSPEEKRAILKELTKKEKKRQEKIDKLNRLPDDLLDEALCYAEFRAQKKSNK